MSHEDEHEGHEDELSPVCGVRRGSFFPHSISTEERMLANVCPGTEPCFPAGPLQ